ncbi:MAG: glyoxalase [Rhodobacterales bacterium]|nr:MAG: glyoxalase [Rhodobacterales bacterium]
MSNSPVLVWCEIPVTDMTRACAFYSTVFGYRMEITTEGPNPMAILNGETEQTAGNLYPGTPSGDGRGPTVHLALPGGLTVEEASDRVKAQGGTVGGPLVEMPFGRWTYATDPDGNSIGLFQGVAS